MDFAKEVPVKTWQKAVAVFGGVLVVGLFIMFLFWIFRPKHTTTTVTRSEVTAVVTNTPVAITNVPAKRPVQSPSHEQKQLVALQKQVSDLQKQLAEARAVPLMERAIDKNSSERDRITHEWTGVPAIIHALKEGEGNQPKARISMSMSTTSSVADRRVGIRSQVLYDQIKQLRRTIGQKEVRLVSTRMDAERTASPAVHLLRTNRLQQREEELVGMYHKLGELEAELESISQ